MDKVDQFESAFRAAAKSVYRFVAPALDRVLLVTDLEGDDANAFADTLVIQEGASVTVNSPFTLQVSGDLDAGYTSMGGTGTVRMVTAATTLRGTVPTLEIQNSILLVDSVIVMIASKTVLPAASTR